MNTTSIYNTQYAIAKQKLNFVTEQNLINEIATAKAVASRAEESGVGRRIATKEKTWDEKLDDWQTAGDIASLGASGVGLGAALTGVGAPVGAVAELGASAIDLVNAATSGARAVGALASGDYAKAGEHALWAGLRGLGAIPIVGTAIQAGAMGGKAVKAATTAEKAVETVAKAAPESAAAARAADEVVAAGRVGHPAPVAPPTTRPRPEARGQRAQTTGPGRETVPARREPATVAVGAGEEAGALGRAGTQTPVAPPVTPRPRPPERIPRTVPHPGPKPVPGKVPTTKPNVPPGSATIPVKVGSLAKTGLRGGRGAAAAAAGAVVGGVVGGTIGRTVGTGTEPPKEEGDINVLNRDEIPVDRRIAPIQLDRLHMFDVGDPGAYTKSTITQRDRQAENPFLPKWSIDPATAEILRSRRDTYTESFDPNTPLKYKVKVAVNKYLNSPSGYQLNKHLETLRKNLTHT